MNDHVINDVINKPDVSGTSQQQDGDVRNARSLSVGQREERLSGQLERTCNVRVSAFVLEISHLLLKRGLRRERREAPTKCRHAAEREDADAHGSVADVIQSNDVDDELFEEVKVGWILKLTRTVDQESQVERIL